MTDLPANWPAHIDAVQAAPEHHTLLMENGMLRVPDTRILPGECIKLHTHRWPAACYIVSPGDFVRPDETGVVRIGFRVVSQKF